MLSIFYFLTFRFIAFWTRRSTCSDWISSSTTPYVSSFGENLEELGEIVEDLDDAAKETGAAGAGTLLFSIAEGSLEDFLKKLKIPADLK